MKPLARTKNIVVQKTGNELLIYDLNKNKAVCLNETSAFVWENCDGNNSISKIKELFEIHFKQLVSDDFIKFAIDELKKEDLLANAADINIEFSEVNRRELIKKIGLGSMVALPILSSLAAPKAVRAQSCQVLAGGCQCGLGHTTPDGQECTPAGPFASTCVNAACRCVSNTATGPDDCLP